MVQAPQFLAPNTALIALGSNLGDCAELIQEAIRRLQEATQAKIYASSLWETLPIDCPPGSPPFINAALRLVADFDLIPAKLLAILMGIENQLGRRRTGQINAPRPIDLDLIACGCAMMHTPELTLPHPRFHLRAFVLAPLAEIAPEDLLPGQQHSISQLWQSHLSMHPKTGIKRMGNRLDISGTKACGDA